MTADVYHLWRAAAFGPRDDQGAPVSYAAAVHALLPWPDEHTISEPPLATPLPPGVPLTLLQMAGLVRWWLNEMATTPWPLREKMVLFWHGHFTSSIDPVFSPGLLLRQNQTLRRLAAGRFEDLLLGMLSDGAMLVYLDGEANHRSHPNENFARELMELFTVGLGHYTERDVQEAARAFTGWTVAGFNRDPVYRPDLHDDGAKTFLGLTGRLTGADVIHHLALHPATARRIPARLFHFLTGLDAPAAEVDRLAAIFLSTRGHIGAVLRALLLGDAFRTCRGGFRSPVEWLVHVARVLDRPVTGLDWITPMRRMGQLPFLPPSVKGWDDGRAWINTDSLLQRINMAVQVSTPAPPSVVALLQNSPPGHAIPALLRKLGLSDASPSTVATLQDLYRQSADPTRLLTVALSSPDFQMK